MPSLTVQDVVVGERTPTVDVVVRLDAPVSGTVSVTYRSTDITARENGDYRFAGGTLTFAPGETTKTVHLDLIDDAAIEAAEHFRFTLSDPVNATIARAVALVQIVDDDTVLALPRVHVDDLVIDEKAGSATFVVRLGLAVGQSSAGTVRVDYATADGTATAGQDYVARSGTLVFAPGENVKTVSVGLSDDTQAEPSERFSLVLSNPVGATVGDGAALAEIGLSDGTPAALPRVAAAHVTAGEGDGYLDVVVTLHAPSTRPVTVGYRNTDISARENADYLGGSGTLTFAPGETVKTVRLQVIDDAVAEAPEHFRFVLTDATDATIETGYALVQLVDNEAVAATPGLFVDDVVVDETDGRAVFVVRLGRFDGESATGAVRVDFATVAGTAAAGPDYVARSGTLDFAPGQSVQTVVVDLVDDRDAELIERFSLRLSNPVGASVGDGDAVAEIGRSDGTPAASPRVSVAPLTVGEGDRYLEAIVTLSAPSTQTVTVAYRNTDISAHENADYHSAVGTLLFAPGETTKTVRMQLIDDLHAEGPEHFRITLSDAVNATIVEPVALIRLVDNDTLVEQPSVHVGDVVVDEKSLAATFVVRLGAAFGESAGGPVSVGFTTRDGTAVAGQDYVARSGTLVFMPGESAKTVVVDLVDDALAEPAERFSLVLSTPAGAPPGDASGVAEIALSDTALVALPRISVADLAVAEADGYVDVAVVLSAPSSQTVSVAYRNSNATAGENVDYHSAGGTLSFAPGETAKTVRMQVLDDLATEGSEHCEIRLSGPVNGTLANAVARITIVDDERDGRTLLSQGRSDDVYTIASTAFDFVEAADGGFDVVRSAVSYTLPAVLEGVILTGTAGNATGHDGANFFQGNARDNLIDGRGGIDTVAFAGREADYLVSGTLASRLVERAGEGGDTLLSIERLQFADTVQAWDTSPGGNTYSACAMLNAAFGAMPGPALLGQWTVQLDRLGSPSELARAMLQYYAPGVADDVLVSHLWGTVVGRPITPAELDTVVGLLDSGAYTQASLLAFASTLAPNTDEIAAIVGQPVAMDPVWFPLPAG